MFRRIALVFGMLLPAAPLSAQDYELLFEQAAELSREGDYHGAIEKYEAALRLRPGAVEVLSNLGVMQYMAGRYEQARQAMSGVLADQGDNFPANLILGLSLVRLGRPQEAMAPLQVALAARPDHEEALYGLAAASLAAGEHAVAVESYLELTSRHPTDGDAWYGLARSYELLAQETTRALADRGTKGADAYLQRFLGEYWLQRGIQRLALEALRQAASLDPGQSGLDALIVRAESEAPEENDREPAPSRAYGSLPSLSAASPADLYQRAKGLAELSRHAFLQMVRLAPDSWQSHLFLGDLNLQRRQFDAAIRHYEQAAGLRPGSAAPLVGLGTAHWELGSHDEARFHLERALAISPENVLVLYELGDIAATQKRFDQAIRYLEQCVGLDAGHSGARAVLGKAYSQTGRFEDAVVELRQAAAIDTYGDIHFQLARALAKLGRAEEAERAMNTSKRIRRERQQREQRLLLGE